MRDSTDNQMGATTGVGLIVYTGTRDELQQKLRERDDCITELEAMILRLIEDAHRMHMIGIGYRDHAQAMLYAEAKKLIGR